MGKIRLRLVAIALAFAGAGLALPATAGATVTWSSNVYGATDPLSQPGIPASDVQVATDAAGDAIAVWLQNVGSTYTSTSSGNNRVAVAYRPAGQNFGNWSYISDDQGDAGSVRIAMNASGEAIVTWNETVLEGEETTLPVGTDAIYAMSSGGGSFGAATEIESNDSGGSESPQLDQTQVGIDSAGDALITYVPAQSDPTPYLAGSVVAQFRPAGTSSSFGAGQVLNDNELGQNEVVPTGLSLAMNGAGAAVAAWDQVDGSGPDDVQHVFSSYRAAGASTSDSGASAGFSGADDISNESDEAPQPGPPAVALDPSGDALLVWDENPSETSELDVQTASKPATAPYFNLPQQVGSYATTLNDPETPFAGVGMPAAAFDASGDAFAMWGGAASADPSDSDSAPHVTDPLSVAYQPAGQNFGTPVQVASGDVGGAQLGVDSQGRQALLWESTDGSANVDIEGTSRDGSSGAFSTPVALTPSGADVDGSVPDLSMSAAGQAVGVWQTYDGSEDVAQATFGTPAPAAGTPTAAPPEAGQPTQPTTSQPPPPAQPTPLPAVINAAAPFQRGRAIVLTATVDPGVTQVEWRFPGSQYLPTDVTGTVVNGQLQTSVRVHPTSRTFAVTVTTVSPIDTETASRTFQLLAQPTDPTTVAVQQELVNTPRVAAVGDAATLLGNTPCGQLTLFVGQQQTSGCLRPVNTASDIPNSELASLQTLARSLGLDPSNPTEMAVAVEQEDGYVAPGQVLLDNQWPVQPAKGASVVSFPGIGALTSSNASLQVGGLNFGGLASGFSLNIDPSKLGIPLGSLPKPDFPDIGGFPSVGDWNIDLGATAADISTSLQLPSWLGLNGIPTQIPIHFKATPTGLELQSFSIGPLNAYLGPLNVTNLGLTYDQKHDTWTGSAEVCLLTGFCLDMTPAHQGGVTIVDGKFNYAGATLDFPLPGIPLFTGVNLTHIGFGVGIDPTRFQGNAAISVLDLVQLQGTLFAGFPTKAHPFYLQASEFGSDFPKSLADQAFSEPTFGVAADVGINLPVIGTAKLASGYFVYEVPDFIALGGEADFRVPHVFDVGGSVAGQANFATDTVNLYVSAHACLLLVGRICADGVADLSKGPHKAGGIGGCIGIDFGFGSVHIGGGIQWKDPTDPIIWPFDGCKWTRFAIRVNPVVASVRGFPRIAVSSRQTIVVKRGAPWPALKVFGQGAAPLVRVTGPDGQSLDSTDRGLDYSPGGAIRILRYQGSVEDFTVVGLENARPGVYTVTTLPGSVPFTTVARATNPPAAKVTAKLTGSGVRRTLTYDIRNRPGQTVTFEDSNAGGAGSATIGHLTGGGRGILHFTAPPGNSARTIYAQFSLDGLPAERIAVAHYQPVPATLARPRDLRVTRTGTRLTVTFQPVSGATAYEVTLTDRLTGVQQRVQGHSDRIVLTHVARTTGGTLAVSPFDTRYARQGPASSVSITRPSMPSSSFRALGRCRKVTGKLACTGGPQAKTTLKIRTKTKTKAK